MKSGSACRHMQSKYVQQIKHNIFSDAHESRISAFLRSVFLMENAMATKLQ